MPWTLKASECAADRVARAYIIPVAPCKARAWLLVQPLLLDLAFKTFNKNTASRDVSLDFVICCLVQQFVHLHRRPNWFIKASRSKNPTPSFRLPCFFDQYTFNSSIEPKQPLKSANAFRSIASSPSIEPNQPLKSANAFPEGKPTELDVLNCSVRSNQLRLSRSHGELLLAGSKTTDHSLTISSPRKRKLFGCGYAFVNPRSLNETRQWLMKTSASVMQVG
jgi:hypothetical protein